MEMAQHAGSKPHPQPGSSVSAGRPWRPTELDPSPQVASPRKHAGGLKLMSRRDESVMRWLRVLGRRPGGGVVLVGLGHPNRPSRSEDGRDFGMHRAASTARGRSGWRRRRARWLGRRPPKSPPSPHMGRAAASSCGRPAAEGGLEEDDASKLIMSLIGWIY